MNKSVLIIEDNAEQCQLLCRLLELRGIQTECAGSWAEGLERLEVGDHDLVILDLALPDSPAHESASTGLAHLRDMNVLVVALTGVDDPELIRHFQRQRIPFVLKPIVTNDFIKTVLTELEWHAPSRELEKAIVEAGKAPLVTFGEPKGWWKRNAASLASAAAVVACVVTVASNASGGIAGLWRAEKVSAIDGRLLRRDVDDALTRVTSLESLRGDVAEIKRELSSARTERDGFNKRLDRIDSSLTRQEQRTDQILTLLRSNR